MRCSRNSACYLHIGVSVNWWGKRIFLVDIITFATFLARTTNKSLLTHRNFSHKFTRTYTHIYIHHVAFTSSSTQSFQLVVCAIAYETDNSFTHPALIQLLFEQIYTHTLSHIHTYIVSNQLASVRSHIHMYVHTRTRIHKFPYPLKCALSQLFSSAVHQLPIPIFRLAACSELFAMHKFLTLCL